ncbi:unnamed protein product [Caenorhabditis bovis]|uniref:RRM domain-containing protein n=1 Tax=Caenorhabditis bovis TaxID=2654633 RepID=A0A8S1ER90_9PELO|nr:unnamed protein product [Caenorhabditis bovis]
MGDDDFWGNGDSLDEKPAPKSDEDGKIEEEEDDDEEEYEEADENIRDNDGGDKIRRNEDAEKDKLAESLKNEIMNEDGKIDEDFKKNSAEEFHSCDENVDGNPCNNRNQTNGNYLYAFGRHHKFDDNSAEAASKLRVGDRYSITSFITFHSKTSSESSQDSGKDGSFASRFNKTDKCSDDGKSTQKDSGAASIESSDGCDAGYRKFFQNRSESEIRAFVEGTVDVLDEKFFECYEQARRELEQVPITNVVHQLRRSIPAVDEQRIRSKHAVVVSNFREPDRRLGRYSKYYYHHNVGPEVYSRKVFVGGLPACVTECKILTFFSRFGRLQVDWPSKHCSSKSDSDPMMHHNSEPPQKPGLSHLASLSPPFGQINPFITPSTAMDSVSQNNQWEYMNHQRERPRQQHLGYVFLLFEKERSVRELVAECIEEEEGLFMTLEDCSSQDSVRVQIRPWLLADAEFLMDFNVPINTKLVAFIGGVPRPLKAVELAHFFEQTYGHVVCVGIDIDNKFKYPRGSGRVAFSNYEAYVQAITDRYIVLDHEDIHKRVEIKPYFFHNQSCEECSGRYHRQHAPYFCPSLECFQYYCEPCWHKMHAHSSRFHHMPVIKGV